MSSPTANLGLLDSAIGTDQVNSCHFKHSEYISSEGRTPLLHAVVVLGLLVRVLANTFHVSAVLLPSASRTPLVITTVG
jgi:hypothetical protein